MTKRLKIQEIKYQETKDKRDKKTQEIKYRYKILKRRNSKTKRQNTKTKIQDP